MVRVMVGNRREVPPNIPIGFWWDRIEEYQAKPEILEIPWYSPELEFLSPDNLARVKAKAFIWWEITGEWPKDINCWWEIRIGRRKGIVPLRNGFINGRIDDSDVLHCGECGARYSRGHDGHFGLDRCNLCGIEVHYDE